MFRVSRSSNSPVEVVPVSVSKQGKNGGMVALAVVLAVVFVVLLGVTIGLVVRNKKRCCGGRSDDGCYAGASPKSLDRKKHPNHQKAGAAVAPVAPSMRLGSTPPPTRTMTEQESLTRAFEYGMSKPPCSFNQAVDAPPGGAALGKPLLAQNMSPMDYAMARTAQGKMIESAGPDCRHKELRTDLGYGPNGDLSTLQAMNMAAGAAQVNPQAGNTSVQRTAAALNAVGAGHLGGPSKQLATANEQNYTTKPGMLADGNQVFGATPTHNAATTHAEAFGHGGPDPTLAMADEDASKFAHTFDMTAKVGEKSQLNSQDAEAHRQNNKALAHLSKSNPELAGQLLLNAGSSVHNPTLGSMQNAWRNFGSMRYGAVATPAFRTMNIPIDAARRMPRAAPVPSSASVTGTTMNMPTSFFDAWRSNTCSGN